MTTDPKPKKSILMVEDDAAMQSLYRRVLERAGFAILTAADGKAAVEILSKGGVDLVVLDLMMPSISGNKVLEAIRADDKNINLPVLTLSNAYLPELAKSATAAGATQGALKSDCSPRRLVAHLNNIFTPHAAASSSSKSKEDVFKSLVSEVNTSTNVLVDEESVLSEVQDELLKTWPADIAMIREHSLKYLKAAGSQDSDEHLKQIYTRLRLLSARATMGGCGKISQLCNTLEAMLFEHGFNLKRSMFPSLLQTMIQAVDCLEYLFKSGRPLAVQGARKNRILLVDDDAVCNMANKIALKRANFETECATDGASALALIAKSTFDLVLLDVNMPGMTGFEVCAKIREIPQYKELPVIFVSLNTDFQSRAQSVLSGSNGYISKPISPLELIVKALIYLLRSQDKETAKDKAPAVAPAAKTAATISMPPVAPVEPVKAAKPANELPKPSASGDDRIKALTESLAAESSRRTAAEQQAAELVKRRGQLEHELAQRTQNLEGLRAQLAEQQQRLDAQVKTRNEELSSLATGTQELQLAQADIADLKSQLAEVNTQVKSLTESLAAESSRRATVEQEAATLAARRMELEKDLAERTASQEQLRAELTAKQQALEAQAQAHKAELEQQAGRTRELNSSQSVLSDLQDQLAKVNAQVQSLNESLAAESGRRASAEQQALELVNLRNKLQQDLVEQAAVEKQLRAELSSQREELAAHAQNHGAVVEHSNHRTKALEAAEVALATSQKKFAEVNAQVQSLTESLAAESNRRASAEAEAAKWTARRTELEHELARRTEAHEKLRAEMAAKQAELEAQIQAYKIELDHLTYRTKESESKEAMIADLHIQLSAVNSQVKSLTESLAAESSRRFAAEEEATKLAVRRSELEQEVAQRSEAQEKLRADLVAKQAELETQIQAHKTELAELTARTAGLHTIEVALAELKLQHASVNAQVQSLTESLATESGRRATAEEQVAELAKHRRQLEQELAVRTQTEEELHAQLVKQEQQLQTQIQAHQLEISKLNSGTHDFHSAQTALTDLKHQLAGVSAQVQSLNESLATETSLRVTTEQQKVTLVARRAELEEEVARRSQAQDVLSAQLAEQKQRLEAQIESQNVELSKLSAGKQEWEASHGIIAELKQQLAGVNAQVQSLTASLATETERRSALEREATQLAAHRTELEATVARRLQTHEELQAQLAAQERRLAEQAESRQVELDNLAVRTKELQAAEAALADLRNQLAEVNGQVKSLTESLARESSYRVGAEEKAATLETRRAELEQEVAQRSQAQEQLQTRLAELKQRLEAQIQTHDFELSRLSAGKQELEVAQTVIAEFKRQLAGVNGQVKSLTESLATESGRRAAVEQEMAQLAAHRAELEETVAKRSQIHEELQAQLAEQERRLAVQVEARKAELDNLAAHTKALQAAEAALADLRNQLAEVNGQVKSLTESLARESSHRVGAEEKAATLETRRAELEQQVTRQSEVQEKLRSDLAAKQQQLEAQVEAHQVELGNLAARTKELEAAQVDLAESKKQIVSINSHIKSLTVSLANESGRRAGAEEKAAALDARRAELEAEVARRSQAQEQLSAQLAEQKQQSDAQIQTHQVELEKLAARTKELQAAEAAIADLRSQLAAVNGQVKSLTESLATESGRRANAEQQASQLAARRAELEQEVAQRTQNQEQLRSDLAAKQQEFEQQVQAHQVELEKLAARTQELQAAEAAIADLRSQLAAVNGQVKSLTESLAAESGRRSNAEQQAAQLVARRTELEAEVAQRAQNQEQLQAHLTEKLQRIEAISAELENYRQRATADALRQKQMAQQIAASEQVCGELGNELSVARELSATREAAIQKLQGELEQQRGEHARLEKLFQAEVAQQHRLLGQLESVKAQLEDTSRQLAQKCEAERNWIGREAELANTIRTQREELAKSVASVATQEAKLKETRQQVEDMQVLQSAMCAKVSALTEQANSQKASLNIESDRREAAEQKVAELVARRKELELELFSQQQELEVQVQAHHAELANLAARTKELEATQAAFAQLNDRHTVAIEQVASLKKSLSAESERNTASEQTWRGREAELQVSICAQKEQLEKTVAILANQETQIKNARKKIEELTVLQSALCTKVQALSEQEQASAAVIQEWKNQSAHFENALTNSQRKLAGMSYAILDAARLSARLARERQLADEQNLEAIRKMAGLLGQTPLSLTQRRMISDLQNSLDSLKKSLPDAGKKAVFQIEPPDLRDSEFSFTEVTESAFQAVRAAAEAAGVIVQTSVTGKPAGKLFGNAGHLHQLIYLLATSPFSMMSGTSKLDLRVAIEAQNSQTEELTARLTLTRDVSAPDLLTRLNTVTAAAVTLQTEDFNEAEFGLATGWQLAQALGAQVTIQGVSGREVCLVLSLPVKKDSRVAAPAAVVAPEPAANGNGHANGNGNGKGHSPANGNGKTNGGQNIFRYGTPAGYRFSQSRSAAAVESK